MKSSSQSRRISRTYRHKPYFVTPSRLLMVNRSEVAPSFTTLVVTYSRILGFAENFCRGLTCPRENRLFNKPAAREAALFYNFLEVTSWENSVLLEEFNAWSVFACVARVFGVGENTATRVSRDRDYVAKIYECDDCRVRFSYFNLFLFLSLSFYFSPCFINLFLYITIKSDVYYSALRFIFFFQIIKNMEIQYNRFVYCSALRFIFSSRKKNIEIQ